MTRRRPGRRGAMALGMALLSAPALALAQMGSRPITLVVPFPPGGSTDLMGRLLAERIQAFLGQPVLVENRGGSATVVGAEYVARAAPDGFTALVNSGTTLTLNPLLMRNLTYKVADFAPVSLLSVLPFAFLVQNRLPATIPDFVALAKAQPGKLNYGTNGASSFNNIAAVLVADRLGIRMQDVTYRGDAQQLNEFLAGTLDLLVVGGASAIQPHRNGQGRIIGWTGERRMPATPDIPTFSEYAPDAVAQTYFGLVVPARTPRPMVERLSQAASSALQEPALRERLLSEGQFALGTRPEEFGTFLAKEAERWAPVLKRMNLQID
ncbi:tripartite tricarboxylate transporter substrate binding protein [Paracraurococcus lichenis]|uniref:Tripartite tricarboxylate transporter substrate binding protein n=1 Tax=Paracraurococcus lichenis TaxID=3064888 RepID=A0ABT9DVQ5_9PROT|nr:tripartite tricarboxylate transporter substrate binding protein [Paracraurococcus sp. LOR1-02]MDO9707968.1 tripartite tricarboxylate transporter substrate binding protein [Paracraurococcus sp. LOR1-02]